MLRCTITKLRAVEGTTHKYLRDGESRVGEFINHPIVGEQFWLRTGPAKLFNTSKVVEIVSQTIFTTLNSVYQYEIHKDILENGGNTSQST